MKPRFLASLRARLLLLVGLSVAPAFLLILGAGLEHRRLTIDVVLERAARAASVEADQQALQIELGRQLLEAVAPRSFIQGFDIDACTHALALAISSRPRFANLGLVRPDGDLACSAVPFRPPVNLSRQTFIQQILAGSDFSVGEFTLGSVTGKPSLHLGYPVHNQSGALVGVLYVALDLTAPDEPAHEAALPAGTAITVFDRAGRVLAQGPGERGALGRSGAEDPVGAIMLGNVRDSQGAMLERGPDGVERLVAYAVVGSGAIQGAPSKSGAVVAVSIPASAALADAGEALARNLISLGVVALAALAVAWITSDLFVVRQAQQLVRAAAQLGRGNWQTRSGVPHDAGEMGMLAESFDEMAGSLEQAHGRLESLAYYDTLTGLPNRALLHRRLTETIRGLPPGRGVAVVFLDLDAFKDVNQSFGYGIGDELLLEVGHRLSSVAAGDATAAYLGEDGFAVVATIGTAEEALALAGGLRRALEPGYQVSGGSVAPVEASLGIALFPEHGRDADTLLQHADVALYAAKAAHSGIAVYDPAQDAGTAQRLGLIADLRRGLDQGELILHYQPKIHFLSGALAGTEALVRWQHPVRGLVPPQEFIALAERSGLIAPLSRWVLEDAIRQCAEWQHEGAMVVPVAVNLSTSNLHEPGLVERVAELLDVYQIPPGSLTIEITESEVMADPQRATEALGLLHALGSHVAIDDFGTGYSSLARLTRLPADELKIDHSFVRRMALDEHDLTIVRSTIDLAHNLGLQVVAEGVESHVEWEILRGLGCDQAQGFYVARPMPAKDLLAWLQRDRGALD